MQLNPKQNILGNFNKLVPKISTFVKVQNQNIREKDQNGQLERIFMAFAVYVSSLAVQTKYPYIIMITASHNPPNYNGIKLQCLDSSQTVNVQEMQSIINDQNELFQFLQRFQINKSNKTIDFFVGRDTRPSSVRLSEILIDTIQNMGGNVVNLGEGSTPQIFSLGRYLFQRTTSIDTQMIKSLQLQYFQEINKLLKMQLSQQAQLSLKSDFANGVGAVSFQKYQFIHQFIETKIINNQNFDQPNVKCGAQWIYKKRLLLPELPYSSQTDFYIWFDGDSDRIIMKNAKQNSLIEGEDFNACFVVWLKQLTKNLGCQLSLGSVGSILTNFGLIKFLQNLKIQYKLASVGISNLYKLAQSLDICIFFEPNGHGCIYFSKNTVTTLQQLKTKYWQAQLLLLIHKITKNNSRGYALHVFLILMLYFHYYQTENAFLFKKTYSIEKSYHLNKPQIFVNSLAGEKLLIQPVILVQQLAKVQKKFNNLSMKMRKSQTSSTLRITIQGQQEICKQCEAICQKVILKYL